MEEVFCQSLCVHRSGSTRLTVLEQTDTQVTWPVLASRALHRRQYFTGFLCTYFPQSTVIPYDRSAVWSLFLTNESSYGLVPIRGKPATAPTNERSDNISHTAIFLLQYEPRPYGNLFYTLLQCQAAVGVARNLCTELSSFDFRGLYTASFHHLTDKRKASQVHRISAVCVHE